jgi:hypothetical protein
MTQEEKIDHINAQIVNGTIDPNWVLTILVAIVAFLLIRILNRMDKRIEDHEKILAAQGTEIAVLKSKTEHL